MGTALCNLKQRYREQKLADGRQFAAVEGSPIRLSTIYKKYYGDAIRKNKGDVKVSMIKQSYCTVI